MWTLAGTGSSGATQFAAHHKAALHRPSKSQKKPRTDGLAARSMNRQARDAAKLALSTY